MLEELDGGEVDPFTGLALPRGVETVDEVFIWTELAGVDRFLQFSGASVTDDGLDHWRDVLVPWVCLYGGLDVVERQLDLVSSWDELFSTAVEKFLNSLGTNVGFLQSPKLSESAKLAWFVAAFDDRCRVDVQAEARESRRLRRQTQAAVELAVLAAAQPAAPKVPVGFVLFRQDPAWEKLLPAAQRVFRVMFSRATNRSLGKGLSCGVSVGLLMKATGYKSRQVERGLAQLRAGGWIGYVVHQSRDGRLTQLRGRPMIGCSRYWVVRRPDQLVKS